jgi:TatD DNase family protein
MSVITLLITSWHIASCASQPAFGFALLVSMLSQTLAGFSFLYRGPEWSRYDFAAQLDLAHEMGKPLIIHCRDAHDDMISLLSIREHTRGVIHSFNGTKDQAAQYIAMGMHIGLNAIITFSQSYDEMVLSIPFDRMLLETDAPYLAPAPHRGGRNEPAYVDIVADHIAGLLGDNREELARRTTANAVLLYGMQE